MGCFQSKPAAAAGAAETCAPNPTSPTYANATVGGSLGAPGALSATSASADDGHGETIKILLLGPGESGKSTLLRQIEIMHDIPTSDLKLYRTCLKRNCAQSMQVLVEQATLWGYDFGEDEKHAEIVANFDLSNETAFDRTMVTAIQSLWDNPAIKKAFARRSEFWLLEAAPYYFSIAENLISPGYKPTEMDIIMTRVVTTGITTRLLDTKHDHNKYILVDVGGQRNERRKWAKSFEGVRAIIFVINMADYTNILYEDATVNRMVEALKLFSTTVNTPMFEDTPFYVVLNKRDLLETSLGERPLSVCESFADYVSPFAPAEGYPSMSGEDIDIDREPRMASPQEVDHAVEYIKGKVLSLVHSGPLERVEVFALSSMRRAEVQPFWNELTDTLPSRLQLN
ncbi:hypothetical protein H696_02643 [Fonticula alba]|uniref:Uncharacterized protein n=1 Tax=Fonticula alba TaxID=691883 RepID=A0A058Z7P0_FONAL|nr:hypothetical protein H696_02643 [Fonticula alba]KCV70314.1 hypothetical protein H696_02643 [Fonticula alba]|eukprot:XP_009494830.1 hypothetical protein H696_02643 [Fonticula alba]